MSYGPKFEERMFGSIEIGQAHQRALESIEADRIDMDDFVDLYGQGVEADKAIVRKRKASFAAEEDPSMEKNRQLGTIFEAIFNERAELDNWFGQNVSTIKTSEFDDVENGVDSALEIVEGASTSLIALGIDVSSSVDLHDKFNKIRGKLPMGN